MQEHAESYVAGHSGAASGSTNGLTTSSGDVDFATLVGSGKNSGNQVPRDMPVGGSALDVMAWDDLPSSSVSTPNPSGTPALTPSHTGQMFPRVAPSKSSNLSSFPVLSSSTTVSMPTSPGLSSPMTASSLAPPPSKARPSAATSTSYTSAASTLNAPPPGWSGSTLSPSSTLSTAQTPPIYSGGANYNISLPPANTFASSVAPSQALANNSFKGLPPLMPQTSSLGANAFTNASTPTAATAPASGPPGWGGSVLQPTSKSSSSNKGGSNGKIDWSDFDPLK
jgi:SCY1-like protein 2